MSASPQPTIGARSMLTARSAGLTSERGLVALVVAEGEAQRLRAFARALSLCVEVRSLGRCSRRPDAIVASSAEAAQNSPGVRHADDVPIALMTDSGVEVDGELVPFPAWPLDVGAVYPRGPLVRRRWRERDQLPEQWVVEIEGVLPDQRAAQLAICTAAVVGLDDLPLALALGTPTVTTSAAAAEIGATADQHLVVGDADDDRIALARSLAADEARAAAMGLAARAFAEERLDSRASVRRVLRRLGLDPGDSSADRVDRLNPSDRLGRRLDELHTSLASLIRHRSSGAISIFTGGTP